jgi:hypothetical protein
MTTINMPGFTAEAALSRTSGHYHLVMNPGQSDGGIHPAFDPTQFKSFTFARCRPRFEIVPKCRYVPVLNDYLCWGYEIIYLGVECD